MSYLDQALLLTRVPRDMIGRHAYGVALERQNRDKFKELVIRYKISYNRLSNYVYVWTYQTLYMYPENISYDRRVNYFDIERVILEQEQATYNAPGDDFYLNIIAYAHYWQTLPSLDTILEEKMIISFNLEALPEFEFGVTSKAKYPNFSDQSVTIPIVYVRSKIISGNRIILDENVNVQSRILRNRPFLGTLLQLAQELQRSGLSNQVNLTKDINNDLHVYWLWH